VEKFHTTTPTTTRTIQKTRLFSVEFKSCLPGGGRAPGYPTAGMLP
jgi:hypothetical protein